MKKSILLIMLAAMVAAACGCEIVDHTGEGEENDGLYIGLEDVAKILSALSIDTEQIEEVYDAVSTSSYNGYDDEYMMKDLFEEPGTGVGGTDSTRAATRAYSRPLKDMIEEYLRTATRAGDGVISPDVTVDEYLAALSSSDIQIYWPYYENWDGDSYPIITFDPSDGSESNTGYRLCVDEDGDRSVEEVIVSEDMAVESPVWVVNRNDDSAYTSLELLRRQDPDWGAGGGDIIIGMSAASGAASLAGAGDSGSDHVTASLPSASGVRLPGSEASSPDTRSGTVRILVLKDFTAHRNFDTWFAGASEFFVKCGSVEDFTATSEDELLEYTPAITDFMIVVKRREVGYAKTFNTVLVSNWTDQLEQIALMITEDDGGTITTWNCSGVVKINSKSYGFEISIPFHSKDDIVWRGRLLTTEIEAIAGETVRFGDVSLTFEILER